MDLLSLPLVGVLALLSLIFSDLDSARLRVLNLKTLLLERVGVHTQDVFTISTSSGTDSRSDSARLPDD